MEPVRWFICISTVDHCDVIETVTYDTGEAARLAGIALRDTVLDLDTVAAIEVCSTDGIDGLQLYPV